MIGQVKIKILNVFVLAYSFLRCEWYSASTECQLHTKQEVPASSHWSLFKYQYSHYYVWGKIFGGASDKIRHFRKYFSDNCAGFDWIWSLVLRCSKTLLKGFSLGPHNFVPVNWCHHLLSRTWLWYLERQELFCSIPKETESLISGCSQLKDSSSP